LVRDLQIIEREDGFWFEFIWQGRGDEWRRALEAVKKRIPPEAREYDEDDQVWRVVEAFEETLGEIFANFAGALDGIRSQTSMF